MEKLDLRKQMQPYYNPSPKKVEVVEMPRLKFIMIDGLIEPGKGPGDSPAFQEAIEALYGAAYTLKFMIKRRKENPLDYPVMFLEGLWAVESGEFSYERKDNWTYTLLILQPELITPLLFTAALDQLRKKKGERPAFARLRLEQFQEGRCIQVMHIGPYANEPATIARMDEFAQQNGYSLHGRHHEIYLGDPLRTQPDKLKTILRHPVSTAT